MPEPAEHHTRHSVTVKASAETVYGLIADVEQWPHVFSPTIHAERLDRDAGTERIRLWALANDEVKTWTSRRELDRPTWTIRFRQEVTPAPAAAMSGEWVLVPQSPHETKVLLDHRFRAIDDAPDSVRWLRQAVERNSVSELGRLCTAAELAEGIDAVRVSFEDSVRIRGDLGTVYEFLNDAGRWPQRLPHVTRVDLSEKVPGIQDMEMDTRTIDGATHTTRSVRVCFPGRSIVYKQTVLPAAMAAHTGAWRLDQDGETVVATSQHTVVLDRAGVTNLLGPDATVEQAKEIVRTALGKNSRTTLEHARQFAEARRG
ncbi:aromatase/cyclase [Micromonospora sp. B11E3]|uniref:aromatase/cyclase n=1 Tax=Micromonospora sp. B11E3 TaxID=3153562 RepID=UPI00325CD571